MGLWATTATDGPLIVRSKKPFNAEPDLATLAADFHTPQAAFYVRNHGGIPKLPADHKLTVTGLVAKPLTLTMDELRQRFAPRTVTATLQCAGNRRADMNAVKKVKGDLWQPGAIGNASWSGVALADVLRAAGAEDGALHVGFSACDEVEIKGERFMYGVSIPMTKAMLPDVLLAYQMNGEPLTPEHGHPLRLVVPGYAGVRSPKWLATIEVRDQPSDNHMQQQDYKLVPPHISEKTVDWQAGLTINELPLNSAICTPAPGAKLQAGPNEVRGYAMASERAVTRVDVSADGGATWQQATLAPRDEGPWSWVLWHCTLDLPKGKHELVVRAWDAAGQTQPSAAADLWNFKGYLSAAWHRVPVKVTR